MLKSFDRYILREIASPFFIGLLVYTSTLLVDHILRLSSLLISKSVSLESIALLIVLSLPEFLTFTIPMSTLMGVLAGMSRMSTDSEVIAFRTMGIPNQRILKPVLLFSLITGLTTLWLTAYVAPRANFHFWRMTTDIALSFNITNLKPGIFHHQIHFYSLYFQDIQPGKEWKNVLLYTPYKPPEKDTLILARKGWFNRIDSTQEDELILSKGAIYSFKKKEPELLERTSFSIKTEVLFSQLNRVFTPRSNHQPLPGLFKIVKREPNNLLANMDFHNRLALPFSSLALGLLGLSLGVSTRRGGKVGGLIISLGIIFVYYTLYTTSRSLIMRHILTPFWGNWLPNMFLLGAGLLAFHHAKNEKEINWERLFQIFLRSRSSPKIKAKVKIPKPGVFILDFYILRRLTIYFFLILVTLVSVFYLITIIELLDDVVENHIPFSYIMLHNLYATPNILTLVTPIAVLTAVLLTFSLMSKHNEITAVQVSGINLFRLIIPSLLLGIIASTSIFTIQETILPNWSNKSDNIRNIILKQASPGDIELNRNWVAGRNDRIFFYNTFDAQTSHFIEFNLVELTPDFTLKRRISSQYAEFVDRHRLRFCNGFQHIYSGDSQEPEFSEFSELFLSIPEEKTDFFDIIRVSTQMNLRQLRDYINFLRRNNSDTRPYEAQWFYHYSYPLSSLIMVLIALPFSFMMGKKGSLVGIGLSVCISLVYWGVLSFSSALGKTAILTPFLSSFIPMILFTFLSLILFIQIKT